MKIAVLVILIVYIVAIAYLYFFQNSIVFNAGAIESTKMFKLQNTKRINFEVEEGIVLDGVYKTSSIKDAPLIIYFGGNADDATRLLLHVTKILDYDIVSFNYRGYVKSKGKPSQDALFSDAIKIYEKYKKDKKVILIGRSLGTGVATYLASKKDVLGVILITPYDSIVSMAKKKYPMFPIDFLLKYKFESVKYVQDIKAPIGLIEVIDDKVISKYHFDTLKQKIPNLSLHVKLDNTTHGEVLKHSDFEKSLENIIDRF